jgi:quercetin dioxygenase-like cupin family protein
VRSKGGGKAAVSRSGRNGADVAVHRFAEYEWNPAAVGSVHLGRYPLAGDAVNDPEERKALGSCGRQPFFVAPMRSAMPEGSLVQTVMELYQTSWPESHEAEEFVLCLSGTAVITVDGTEFILEPMEAVCFDAGLPHRYGPRCTVAAGDEPTVILVVEAKCAKPSPRRKRGG